MTEPLRIFWSKAAIKAAGDRLAAVLKRAFEDIAYFDKGCGTWSLHVVEDGGRHYLFRCYDDDNGQAVFIQTAHYVPMDPLPDDHPDPERRGKVFKYPVADKTDGNEDFEETGMIQ